MAAGDTNTWAGASNDWAVAGNWSAAAIPIDQEHAVFPETNSQTVTANVDRQGDTAGAGLDLRSLTIHQGFTPNLGTAGSPLKFTVDNTDITKPSILHRGSGTLYYNAETGTGGHTTGTIIIDSDNMDNAATIGGDVNISYLICRRGRTELISAYSGTLAWLFVTYRNNPSTDTKVVLGSSATAIASVVQNGGVVESNKALTSIYMSNGKLTQTTQAITLIYVAGGTFVHDTTSTVASVYLAGGVYDTTQTSGAKTITNLWRMPGATFLRSPQLTVTNEYPFNIPEL